MTMISTLARKRRFTFPKVDRYSNPFGEYLFALPFCNQQFKVPTAQNLLRLKLPRTAQARRLLLQRDRLVLALQETWREHSADPAEIEVAFIDEPSIQRLHYDYLQDPSSTDIITFDLGLSPEQIRLGALYICPEVAERHASKFKTSTQKEAQRLIAHGILHLLGYDDHSPADRRRMRRREKKILALIAHPKRTITK